MGVIWHKVWFDLWHYRVRTMLTVLSIAAGVFVIGVVFGMSDQLLAGMDQAQQANRPSHISMTLDAYLNRDAAASIRKLPGVEEVEPYNTLAVNYKLRPEDDWKQGAIMMRDRFDRQRMNLMGLKAGLAPGKNQIGIERMSASALQLGIGDHVILKRGDSEQSLAIGGLIRHPFTAPLQVGGPAYFFMDAAELERFDVPEGLFRNLYVRVTPYSEEHAKEVAAEIKSHLAKQGIGVTSTTYQDPNKHWGRMYTEGIVLVTQLLAIVSLVLSVVLVYNTLTALITQQTNQIGILKAIGGKATTIIQVYLVSVLVYGLLALLPAVPLGMYLAFMMTKSFLTMMNIDYDAFHFSIAAVLLQVLAATAVPLIAALIPVLQGARITVRQAIASYGLCGDFASGRLDRLVGRFGAWILPSHYATALGNLFRHKERLALTQLVLGASGSMFLIIMSLSSSTNLTMNQAFANRRFDVTLSLRASQRIDRLEELARQVPGIDAADVWFNLPVSILHAGQRAKEAGMGAELDGIPAGSDFYREVVVEGRWLESGDERVIVMNKETADKNDIRLGDTVTLDAGVLGKKDWQAIGLYQVIYGGAGFMNDLIFAPRAAVLQSVNKYERGTTLYVRTRAREEPSVLKVTAQLKDLLESRSIKLGSSLTEIDYRRRGEAMFGVTITMLLALAVIVALVGGIALMGVLSISVVERTKEIGVLRAVGARSRTVIGIFVMEGTLQGLASWALSVFVSLLLSRPMAEALGCVMLKMPLSYQYNTSAVVVWLVVILAISTLASLMPARRAGRISVRESLAYA